MPYHYRITVDLLEAAHPQANSEGGLCSLSFFVDTPYEIFATANHLRNRHSLRACDATKLAMVQGLLGQNAVERYKFQES